MMTDSEVTTPDVTRPTAAPTPKTGKPKGALKKSAKPKAKKPAARKKVAPKKAPTKKPAAKKAAPKLSGIPNKSEFIRRFPNLPAKEVVARAKELGATITESYVYNTRGLLKKGGKGRVNRLATKLAANGAYGKSHLILMDHSSKYPTPATEAKPLTVEELFYAVVAEIGTQKAIQMLIAARGVVQSALSGTPAPRSSNIP